MALDHGRMKAGLASVVAVLVLAVLWWLGQPGGEDPPDLDPVSGLPVVAEADLPVEAVEVLADIDAGGPYAYDRDGITFGNYEGLLPDEARGFYREYTVTTPGVDHRGARRIVVGGSEYFYWTADHYESFARIRR
jgi:ribonuclease T1